MDKEKTLYISYYDYEHFQHQMKRLLENKELWESLLDDRNRLEKIELVVSKAECLK